MATPQTTRRTPAPVVTPDPDEYEVESAEDMYDAAAETDEDSDSDVSSITFDLEGYEAPKYELIPVGAYDVEVTEVLPKKSKNGDPQLALKFTIRSGQWEGHELPFWITFPSKENLKSSDSTIAEKARNAAGRSKDSLLLINPDIDIRNFNLGLAPDDLMGQYNRAVVKHEPYNGEQRANIRKLEPPRQAFLETLEPE